MSSILSEIFDNLDWQTPTRETKEVIPYEYRTVHKVDREPVTLVYPLVKSGPWIAGGAALRWYQGMPVGESDIDVFCRNAVQAQEVIARIKESGRYSVKFESDNAVTLDYWSRSDNNRWTIQVITRRYFSSLDEVINNFDLTVCQVGTGGDEWQLGVNTAKDIREKNLRFTQPLHADAMKRLTKYWIYGFRPVEGTLESIQNNPDAKWHFEIDGDYQNAF